MIKTLFSFKGRVNRLKLLLVGLCITPFSFILTWNSPFLALENPVFLIAAKVVLFPICWWISLALFIKRFHDLNKSGWWCLTLLIPIFNIYSLFILYFKKGTIGDNQYGEDPLNSVESHNVSYRNSIALTIIVLVILNLVYFSSNISSNLENISKTPDFKKLKFTELENKKFCYEDTREIYLKSSGTVNMVIDQYRGLFGDVAVINYNPEDMSSLTFYHGDNKFIFNLGIIELVEGECVKIKSIDKNSNNFSSLENYDDFEEIVKYFVSFNSNNPAKNSLGNIYGRNVGELYDKFKITFSNEANKLPITSKKDNVITSRGKLIEYQGHETGCWADFIIDNKVVTILGCLEYGSPIYANNIGKIIEVNYEIIKQNGVDYRYLINAKEF